MSGQLRDDGTLDTVISCPHCGEGTRYTFRAADHCSDYPEVEQQNYREWVNECIEDFDSSHECEGVE